MSFQQFHTRSKQTVTISKTVIHITDVVFGFLNEPERVNILFDKGEKALWLQPDQNGTNKVSKGRGKYYYISSKISNELPLGWYEYAKPTQDTHGSIFKYICPSPKRKANT